MPLKNESYCKSYKFINGYPILFLNISQDENKIIDVSKRFKNDYNECLLSYKILDIEFNGTSVYTEDARSFISISKNGILSVIDKNNMSSITIRCML